MKNMCISILIALTIFLGVSAASSNADEVVLCVSESEGYVVLVNNSGDCLENESETVLSGTNMESLKSLTPVASFKPDDKCGGEGTITEIGFDANGNGKLDAGEIVTSTANCKPAPPEEDES